MPDPAPRRTPLSCVLWRSVSRGNPRGGTIRSGCSGWNISRHTNPFLSGQSVLAPAMVWAATALIARRRPTSWPGEITREGVARGSPVRHFVIRDACRSGTRAKCRTRHPAARHYPAFCGGQSLGATLAAGRSGQAVPAGIYLVIPIPFSQVSQFSLRRWFGRRLSAGGLIRSRER